MASVSLLWYFATLRGRQVADIARECGYSVEFVREHIEAARLIAEYQIAMLD